MFRAECNLRGQPQAQHFPFHRCWYLIVRALLCACCWEEHPMALEPKSYRTFYRFGSWSSSSNIVAATNRGVVERHSLNQMILRTVDAYACLHSACAVHILILIWAWCIQTSLYSIQFGFFPRPLLLPVIYAQGIMLVGSATSSGEQFLSVKHHQFWTNFVLLFQWLVDFSRHTQHTYIRLFKCIKLRRRESENRQRSQ